MSICLIESCGKAAYVRGWCNTHYHRWHRYGDPNAKVSMPNDPRPWERLPDDQVSYRTMHLRLRSWRGPAKLQLCIDCDKQARDWSYDGGCDEQRQSAKGFPFCLHVEHYIVPGVIHAIGTKIKAHSANADILARRRILKRMARVGHV